MVIEDRIQALELQVTHCSEQLTEIKSLVEQTLHATSMIMIERLQRAQNKTFAEVMEEIMNTMETNEDVQE